MGCPTGTLETVFQKIFISLTPVQPINKYVGSLRNAVAQVSHWLGPIYQRYIEAELITQLGQCFNTNRKTLYSGFKIVISIIYAAL